MPKVAIIIVTYNGEKYLADLLASLSRQTYPQQSIQIIAVDNASQDSSVEILARFKRPTLIIEAKGSDLPAGSSQPSADSYQQGQGSDPSRKLPEVELSNIKIIRNRVNRGFAKANNQGIKLALKDNSDFIFLLNQDTICHKNCLQELVKAAGEEVFACQPLILCWPEKDKIQTSGDRIHFLGFGFSGDYKKPIEEARPLRRDGPLPTFLREGEEIESLHVIARRPKADEAIPYASGAAMFINARALKQVGLLDKDLFMYHEDLDLCLRARFLGYQIKLAPQAIIYHKYSLGIPAHRWYWSERNRLITLFKFYKLPTLILIFLPWLFMEIGVLFYSLLTGWGRLKIKSYFSFFWQLPKTLWKRRKIQRRRKISDRELAEYLEGRFDFRGLEHPLLKYLVNPIFGFSWYFLKKLIVW